jgi:hypothetical protein
MFRTLGVRLRAEVSNRLCLVALVGGMATLAGCASTGATSDRSAPHPELSGLIVRNNNWNSMTIYLVQGGARMRVGDVGGFSQAVFPAKRLSMLAGGIDAFLVARPLAGRAFRSERLMFPSTGMVVWTIENQPAHSYLSVLRAR